MTTFAQGLAGLAEDAQLGSTPAPSVEQRAILDWVKTGEGHALVSAVAGAGKTTTLVMAAHAIRGGGGRFFAFNRRIADTLGRRLAGTGLCASTIHAFGFEVVRRHFRTGEVDGYKYNRILRQVVPRAALRELGTELGNDDASWVVADVLHALRSRCLEPTPEGVMLAAAAVERTITPETAQVIAPYVQRALEVGIEQAPTRIDYADMLWLPIRCGLPTRTFPWVFVDEAQDLTPAQRQLVLRAVGPTSRVIAVGDRLQAIYGWAGADAASMDLTKTALNAVEMPLSVSYRCPAAVLRLARVFNPVIQARPNAPEGRVRAVSLEQGLAEVAPGDMVLCRTNAPAVLLCLRLLMAGRGAQMVGRDIGRPVISTIRALSSACHGVWGSARLIEALPAYVAAQRVLAFHGNGDLDDPVAYAAIGDRAAAAHGVLAYFPVDSADDLRALARQLFGEELHPTGISVSTVHRAKGLEARRVFLLYPELMPLRFDVRDASGAVVDTVCASPQEDNLRYVAVTRALEEFTFVGGCWPEWEGAQDALACLGTGANAGAGAALGGAAALQEPRLRLFNKHDIVAALKAPEEV